MSSPARRPPHKRPKIPLVLHVVVFDCGSFRVSRTPEGAARIAEFDAGACCSVGGHQARVIPYRPHGIGPA